MKLNKFTQYIADNWQGKQPLWVPFWLHGFGVGTLLGAFFTHILIERASVLVRLTDMTTLDNFAGAGLLAYSILTLLGFWLTYYIWNFVSVWRCAANSAALTKWGARGFILLVLVSYWGLMLSFIIQLVQQSAV